MKKGALFKAVRVGFVLVLALFVAILLVSLKPKAEKLRVVDAGRLVETFSVSSETVNIYIEAYGTVRPSEALKMVAEVRGKIVGLDATFEEGDAIKKGTPLIRIDPRDYELEVDRRKVQIKQADAELKRLVQEVRNLKSTAKIAETDLALAKNDFARLKKLVNKKVVSQSAVDRAEQKYLSSLERLQNIENQMALMGPRKEQLVAQREMAAVMLRQAELNLERTVITAPFDGWVLEKLVEIGQHVNAAQYLGRIYNAGELEVEARISVKDLRWFPGTVNSANPLDAEVIFESGSTHHAWKGQVTRLKAQMDQKTRTLPVIVEIDEGSTPEYKPGSLPLRPGMFVAVRIKGRQITQAFVVPRHVVHPGDVVYTVEDDLLKIRPVNVLRRQKESVIINEGLEEGVHVVKTPLSAATEGMKVRTK
jgi:multidrug efflux pump subunit AcrA (membrane-fusion protein)